MGLGTIVGAAAGVLVAIVVLLATEVGVEGGSGVLQAPKTRKISSKLIMCGFNGLLFIISYNLILRIH